MEYRRLGRSGLKISTITMGTMTIGGGGKFAQVGDVGIADARRYVDLCLDAGVNLIDTADIYSTGACEEIIGEVLGGKRKDGVLIATKARFSMGPGPNDGGLSRHHLISACEASLKRLKTDVIDLYQVHEWDGQTPLEETMEALDTLVRQGKVRYIGCSNYSGWHIMKALGISALEHRQRFVSQQIHYTLEAREAEYELVPISIDQGLGILVWSPLAGGLLSGKHRRGQSPEGTRSLPAGTSRRSATRNGCGRSSTCWWRSPPSATCPRRRSRCLAYRPRCRHLGDHRRAHRGPVPRQSRRRRPEAHRRGTRTPRRRQPAAGALSLLASLWTAKDRLGEADLSLLGPHI